MSTQEKKSIKIHKETHERIIKTRGKMESDGKRRTIEDVINELIDIFESTKRAGF